MATGQSPKSRAKRIITVDGIRYSLDTGDTIGQAARPVVPKRPRVIPKSDSIRRRVRQHAARPATKALPKVVHFSGHTYGVIKPEPTLQAAQALHPHNVSHPSLPLPQHSEKANRARMSLWRDVIAASFVDGRDSVSLWASLGIVILSPLTWLAILIPATLVFLAQLQRRPVDELYASFMKFILGLSFAHITAVAVGLAAFLGLVWFIRHMCLSVAYGLASRHADNRPVNARVLWWQAAGKMWRLVLVAAFELLLVASIGALTVSALRLSLTLRTSAEWSLFFMLALVIGLITVIILAIHRPLSRVMLVLTNRRAGSIVAGCLGLMIRNWLQVIVLSGVWLIIMGATVALVAAVSWATIAYGLVAITTLLGRLLLVIFAAALIIAVLMAFTIWSVDFWPRSYRWLVLRAYPRHISHYMSAQHTVKSRRTVGLQMLLLIMAYGFFMILIGVTTWRYAKPLYERSLDRLPASVQGR